MRTIFKRLDALESSVPDLGKREVWIQHDCCRVKLIINGVEHLEPMNFENLLWACRSVQYHARLFSKVRGIVSIWDIRQIFSSENFVMPTDKADFRTFGIGMMSLHQFDFVNDDYAWTLVNSWMAGLSPGTGEEAHEEYRRAVKGIRVLLDDYDSKYPPLA